MYEQLVGKSSPGVKPTMEGIKPLVECYMTSFMKTLFKHYKKEKAILRLKKHGKRDSNRKDCPSTPEGSL